MASKVVDLSHYRWVRSMERMYGKDVARRFDDMLHQLAIGTFSDPNVPSMLRPDSGRKGWSR